jgi:DNA mismatch endonuclease (patch repair protein)
VWECALKGRTRLPLEAVVGSLADWLQSDAPVISIEGAR